MDNAKPIDDSIGQGSKDDDDDDFFNPPPTSKKRKLKKQVAKNEAKAKKAKVAKQLVLEHAVPEENQNEEKDDDERIVFDVPKKVITSLEDYNLCVEILNVHAWDLELAISSFTTTSNHTASPEDSSTVGTSTISNTGDRDGLRSIPQPLNITLLISVITSSLSLIFGMVGLKLWATGGVLSYLLRMIGVGAGRDCVASALLVLVSVVGNETTQFVARFEQDFGTRKSVRSTTKTPKFPPSLLNSVLNNKKTLNVCNAFTSEKPETLLRHLHHFARSKESEIEEVCNVHYQDFILAVDELRSFLSESVFVCWWA
ncbi:FAS-associated factor 2-like [Pyrus ussuriensis x Pyrus communis]|uniref:FAS-associated factor 2-like n=1 Tax=Pyrus ussuriensis x Pyrus communis TaxID=2448454 RepID=A0A5N5GX18_9ROSA|nr:FAS-associated factor 2-like [Pyrus ussuriensis x Pyrus communis]